MRITLKCKLTLEPISRGVGAPSIILVGGQKEEGVRRVKLLMLAVVLTATTLATNTGTASAQGYTGWIEHPYPSAGYWWCEYSGSAYWCQDEWGNWFPANPDWYNAAYAEMMRVYGQGVL
jgi:hypothetical protein